MQKLFLKLSGVAILLTLLIATGCEEDDPIIDQPLGPEIAFNAEQGFIANDAEIEEGDTFSVKLTLSQGDNPLRSLRMLIDGTAVPGGEISKYVTNISAGNEDITPNNPLLITGANTSGATYSYTVVPFDQEVDETRSYAWEVTDEAGETASVSVSVTVVFTGTPIERELNGVLFNQAGPAGRGGLDLDNGVGTGSSAAEAEIQDEGINLDLPQENDWRRQISSANDAVMRIPDFTKLPENFSFENIATKEEIKEAFDTGLAPAGDDAPCNCTDNTSGEEVSEPVQAGDLFLVNRGDNYYIIRVDVVNNVFIAPDTPGNNEDNYEVSIKY